MLNLSGSDSISGVSNQSAVKSEKSQNTKSSISSINKSTESLNEKSMSLSGGKMLSSFENNLSRDQNSDTDKITSSGTNDESTLTLTEMVHSMTSEWSTSTSQTLVEHDVKKQQQILDQKYVDKSKTSVEYMPLKPPKNIKRSGVGNVNEKETMAGIHQPIIVKPKIEVPKPTTEKPTRLPPKIVDMIEKPKIFPKPKIPVLPPVDFDKNDSNGSAPNKNNGKKPPLPPKSQQPKSQELSESESYSDKLYNQCEKKTERYQSQEFSPFAAGASTSKDVSKALTKHHSYDDKTLSKSQIREYKSSKVRQSQSFHEHLLSKDLNKIEEEKLSSSTHTSETTSTENSSPMFQRPDKLIKCSPYYSSSLSSDTPSIHQAILKPPRKTSIPKTLQTQSSNDTDSSMDFQAQVERNRGYRKKKQIPSTKRIKMDRTTEQQESSEYSDIPDVHSSSSDNAKRYSYFEEEPENLPEDCDDYGFKIEDQFASSSSKFETLDMSENVDEMGFPRYDRLRHMATNLPPQKPMRQKKKTTSKTNYPNVHYGHDSGSNSETKAGLSDDVYYSSEDSFAAGFMDQKPSTSNTYRNIELPYPDFLSDNDEINEATMAAAAAVAYSQQQESFDSEEDEEASENRKY